MKKTLFSFLLIVAIACNNGNNNNTTDSTSASENTTDSLIQTNTDGATSTRLVKDDSEFAVKAADGGMMEVEAGNLAQQKATSERVKNFGGMMVTDHTKANDELKSIASAKGLMLPTQLSDKHQKHIADLSKKTGTDFDKAYMSIMVDDHKEDIDEFKEASEKSKDDKLKTFTTTALPVLQKHLDSATAINKTLKK